MEVADAMLPDQVVDEVAPVSEEETSRIARSSRGETEPRDELEISPHISEESSPQDAHTQSQEEHQQDAKAPQEQRKAAAASSPPSPPSSTKNDTECTNANESHKPVPETKNSELNIPDLIKSDDNAALPSMKPASPSAEPQPKLEEIKQEEQTLQTVPVSSSDSNGGFNSSTETDGAPPPPPPAVLNVPVIIPTASVNNSDALAVPPSPQALTPSEASTGQLPFSSLPGVQPSQLIHGPNSSLNQFQTGNFSGLSGVGGQMLMNTIGGGSGNTSGNVAPMVPGGGGHPMLMSGGMSATSLSGQMLVGNISGVPGQMLVGNMGGSQAGQMLVGNVAGTPVSQMFVGNMTGSPTGGQMLVGNIAAGGASGVASANTGGGPTPPGKMIVGNIGPTPPAGAAGSATSPAAAGQMIVGGATAAAAGQAGTHQLLLSSGSGQLMVGPGQLPVVIPSTSSSLSSQPMQLPLVVGRPTPSSSQQMLLHLPQSMLHLQQLNSGGGGSKIMKIGAPLQLVPTTSGISSPTLSSNKFVSIGQPVKTSLVGQPVKSSLIGQPVKTSPIGQLQVKPSLIGTARPRFVSTTKLTKPSLQLQSSLGPRKSIVLKNPAPGGGPAAAGSGYVTFASAADKGKPFPGKIVGKVPSSGVLRFTGPTPLKPNQVYLTKIEGQGGPLTTAGGEVGQLSPLTASDMAGQSGQMATGDISGRVSLLTGPVAGAGHHIGSLAPTGTAGQEVIKQLSNFQSEKEAKEPVEVIDLDKDTDDHGDMSLECNEEFDDSFEKKEADSTQDKNEDIEEADKDPENPKEQDEPADEGEDDEEREVGDDEEAEDEPDNADNQEMREPGGIETLDLLKPLKGHVTGPSNVKVKTNEFGMMEVEDLGLGSAQKMDESGKPSEGSNSLLQSPRKNSTGRRIQDDEILYCEGCGCYGMAGEFVAQNSCSNTCNNVIQSRSREKQRRERELQLLRMRRDEKKMSHQAKVKRKGLSATATEEEISNWKSSQYNQGYSWQDAKKGFIWSKYLEDCGVRAAPVRLFPGEPFPDPHAFREGMKLEAIDPLHQSLICVVSVAEVLGPRLRLHFDGYGDSHDFWENADSENLFPVGWSTRNNQKLTPPKGYGKTEFDWETYLRQTSSIAAPDSIFVGRARAAVGADSAVHGWKIGMKVEACDRQNKSLVCVATVGNVLEGRVLLHFDGWEIDYDYWTKPSSHNVKPVGWCSANKKQLNPPKGNHPSAFSWADYLLHTKSKPVPAWAFRSPGSVVDESDFVEGMRLEAVDVYNPKLVRVVSVAAVEGRQIEVHYDGWPEEMNHWRDDDDPALHPCGWAAKTGHPLMAPLTPQEIKHWGERGGCETPGCRGIGHIKGAKYTSHHSVSACPYSQQNLDVANLIPDRLQGAERERGEENRLHQLNQSVGGAGGEALGRGNRRRKKRRFFDEEISGLHGSRRRLSDDSEAGEERLRPGSISPEEAENGRARPRSRTGSRNNSNENLNNHVKDEVKSEPGIKDEPMDLLAFSSQSNISTQTSPRPVSASPPPFATEWEEGVRRSVWQPGYLPQPEPPGTLSANWAEHSKILLGGRTDNPALSFNRAKHWSTNQVVDFLNGIPNLDYAVVEESIRQQEIDGQALLLLTQNDITSLLGVKLGPAIKIYNAIMAVRMRRE